MEKDIQNYSNTVIFCGTPCMLDAISFLLEPVNVACHSLNILSIDSNFTHLCVF